MQKILLILLVILGGGLFWVLLIKKPEPISRISNTVKIGKTVFNVETVRTPEAMQKGLGGHAPLKNNEGMLFVFPPNVQSSIWMKDMLFPIDIIWIKSGKVFYFAENAPAPKPGQALSDLPIYSPSDFAEYVLEAKAGTVEKMGIKKGDSVILNYQF